MKKPIKKEYFLRHKDPIVSPNTNIDGTKIIHGHDVGFNDDITDYYTSINCGVLLDNNFDVGISLESSVENRDGYIVGRWMMTCPPELKLGQVMDRVPFGIVDKTITGLGATTLELTTDVRSSIVVVPTKALAYNKHISINHQYDGLTMYVGSKYGNINRDISKVEVEKYLKQMGDKIRKFITVADSLPKLLGYLEELQEPVYTDYFLMIDEIDTMQMDSSYRPRLEVVSDYYFKFDFMNRAMVSATIQPFSNSNLENEGRVLLKWNEQPKRNIHLVASNYVDDAAMNVISNLKDEAVGKILVAYNSLDGIFNIIKLLGLTSDEYGILCGNRSTDKVNSFDENALGAISENGELPKRITFITCAFFAGIDIIDSCHLVSISSFNQPFTNLSIAKLTQIAGRFRKGNLSETIIYDIANRQDFQKYPNALEYRKSLLSRAHKYGEFLNSMTALISSDRTLKPLESFVKSYVMFAAKDKPNSTDYPLTIVREHSLTKQFVPSYFNIDALVDRWETINKLYLHELALYNALLDEGHNVTIEAPIFVPAQEHITDFTKEIRQATKERLQQQFEDLRSRLLDWESNNKNDYAFEEIRRDYDKRLQDNVILPFKQLHDFIQSEFLLNGLKDCFLHNRKLRNYINAAVFYALPAEHPFKATMLSAFGVDQKTGVSLVRFNLTERQNKTKEVFASVLKFNLNYDPSVLADLLASFFSWARSCQGNRVVGLNPFGFPMLKNQMSVHSHILNMLVFPM